MPGYSAACSLSGPLPGLCMEEAAGVVDALLHRWLPCGYPAAGLGRQVLDTFCDEHGNTRAQVAAVTCVVWETRHSSIEARVTHDLCAAAPLGGPVVGRTESA